MIHAVRANQSSFRAVEFTSGFNVVLADRTKDSTKKDSRNGLGKSTLIEIIHFCLGAGSKPNKGLRVKALQDWSFSIELSLGERRVIAHRSTQDAARVHIEGDTAGWKGGKRRGDYLDLHVNEWTAILGEEMFGVPVRDRGDAYTPSFRSAIGYFTRRGRDAFSTPFEHHRKQKEWDKQVNNAYLLCLSCENAQAWQVIKDQSGVLDTLKKAVTTGVIEGMVGTVGELEAEKVRLEDLARRQGSQLQTFRVHPEYRDIEQHASELTRQIHDLSNTNVMDRRMLEYYNDSLADVSDAELEGVAELYEEAGVKLPGSVIRRLEDVKNFHHRVVENRKQFLRAEVERFEAAVDERDKEVQRISDDRARLMQVLQEHGALEEYTALQQRLLDVSAQIRDVDTRLQNLRKFDAGKSTLKIDQELLLQRARRDHDERHAIRERAISLFNSHSQALYQAPGRLVIDITDKKGYSFNVEIQRSGSEGIDKMKVFCYDLMLAQLWAQKPASPSFLIHDSTLFDGVDERQRALALERAAVISADSGFQYICTLNSDTLPVTEFSSGFDLNHAVRLRLTDEAPEGSLLGIRY